MKVMQFKVETGQKVLDLKVILLVYSSHSMSLENVSYTNICDHGCAGSQRRRCRNVSSPKSGRSLCHWQC